MVVYFHKNPFVLYKFQITQPQAERPENEDNDIRLGT